jgi:hypothetical protein
MYVYVWGNIQAGSEFCNLEPSQMIVAFNSIWSQFLLLYTVLHILQNVFTATKACYYISLKKLYSIFLLWFCVGFMSHF